MNFELNEQQLSIQKMAREFTEEKGGTQGAGTGRNQSL